MNKLNLLGKALFVCLTFLLIVPQNAHARARIPVGTRDVIDVVYNIPAEDSIIIDGKNVNLARMHKEFNIAYFLPLWVTEEPKLVLYDAPTETYYETQRGRTVEARFLYTLRRKACFSAYLSLNDMGCDTFTQERREDRTN